MDSDWDNRCDSICRAQTSRSGLFVPLSDCAGLDRSVYGKLRQGCSSVQLDHESTLDRRQSGKFIRRMMATKPGSECKESNSGSDFTLTIPPDRSAWDFSSQVNASLFFPIRA